MIVKRGDPIPTELAVPPTPKIDSIVHFLTPPQKVDSVVNFRMFARPPDAGTSSGETNFSFWNRFPRNKPL